MFSMSDSEVFREVDEDYRRDRMMAFWRRYGTTVAAAAVVVAIVALGVNYYLQRQQAEKEAETARFEALLSGLQPGNEQEAIQKLSNYAASA